MCLIRRFCLLGLLLGAGAAAQVASVPVPVPVPAPPAAVEVFGEPQLAYLAHLVEAIERRSRSAPANLLRDRVSAAVRAHPLALAADAGVRTAQESTREIQASMRPQVSALVDAGHRKTDASTVLDAPWRRYETASAGLTLRQLLHDGGATRAAVDAGRERETALAVRAENRRADIALQAVEAWTDVVRQRERLRLLRSNVGSLAEMVDFLSRREQLGASAQSDVWRARTRLAEARAALAGGQARVGASEAAFRETFGAEPGELSTAQPPAFDRAALAADAAAAVSSNSAVRSAEAARSASEMERESVERRANPQVSAEVNTQRRDILGQGKPGTDVSAFVTLRYNFYTGGADDARAQQARSRATEAAEQARSVRAQVERALAQALAEDSVGSEVLDLRRDAVVQASLSLRAVRELFLQRRGLLLELLAAQEQLNAAGLQLVDAEAEALLARWRLLYFSADFWPTLGIDRAPESPRS